MMGRMWRLAASAAGGVPSGMLCIWTPGSSWRRVFCCLQIGGGTTRGPTFFPPSMQLLHPALYEPDGPLTLDAD